MMSVFVIGQIMVVLVTVGNRMLVRAAVMCMHENVCMLMSVFVRKRVDHDEYRSCNHNSKGDKKHP